MKTYTQFLHFSILASMLIILAGGIKITEQLLNGLIFGISATSQTLVSNMPISFALIIIGTIYMYLNLIFLNKVEKK